MRPSENIHEITEKLIEIFGKQIPDAPRKAMSVDEMADLLSRLQGSLAYYAGRLSGLHSTLVDIQATARGLYEAIQDIEDVATPGRPAHTIASETLESLEDDPIMELLLEGDNDE